MENAATRVKAFLDRDLDRIDNIIEQYPDRVPVPALADFLHMDVNSARAAVEGGAFGFAWRKDGKVNKAYCIPTAQFVRWYLGVDGLEGVYRNEV